MSQPKLKQNNLLKVGVALVRQILNFAASTTERDLLVSLTKDPEVAKVLHRASVFPPTHLSQVNSSAVIAAGTLAAYVSAREPQSRSTKAILNSWRSLLAIISARTSDHVEEPDQNGSLYKGKPVLVNDDLFSTLATI